MRAASFRESALPNKRALLVFFVLFSLLFVVLFSFSFDNGSNRNLNTESVADDVRRTNNASLYDGGSADPSSEGHEEKILFDVAVDERRRISYSIDACLTDANVDSIQFPLPRSASAESSHKFMNWYAADQLHYKYDLDPRHKHGTPFKIPIRSITTRTTKAVQQQKQPQQQKQQPPPPPLHSTIDARIAFLVTFAAKRMPAWFPYWIESCRNNAPYADFFLFTTSTFAKAISDATATNLTTTKKNPFPPDNVKVLTVLDDREFISKRLAIRFTAQHIGPKLCDLKPAYGQIFREFIPPHKYTHWGWCDTDMVFGDLGAFLHEEHLATVAPIVDGPTSDWTWTSTVTGSRRKKHVIITLLAPETEKPRLSGQLAIYQNTPESYTLYKRCTSWQEQIQSSDQVFFDEACNSRALLNSPDVQFIAYSASMSDISPDSSPMPSEYSFRWVNGRLFGLMPPEYAPCIDITGSSRSRRSTTNDNGNGGDGGEQGSTSTHLMCCAFEIAFYHPYGGKYSGQENQWIEQDGWRRSMWAIESAPFSYLRLGSWDAFKNASFL